MVGREVCRMQCWWLRARRWRLRGRVFDVHERETCLWLRDERIWARRRVGCFEMSVAVLWLIGGRVTRGFRYW